MKRNTNRHATKVKTGATHALQEYVSFLNEVYPLARGKTRVVIKANNRVMVNVPLPKRAPARMRLFDQIRDRNKIIP